MLIIDNDRPQINTMGVSIPLATSGDDIVLTIVYDQPMHLLSSGEPITTFSSQGGSGPPLVELMLSIVPLNSSLPEARRRAPIMSVEGPNVTFRLRITPEDPSGSLVLGSASPLLYALDSMLLAAKNDAPGPVTFPANLQAQFSISGCNCSHMAPERWKMESRRGSMIGCRSGERTSAEMGFQRHFG